MSVRHLEDLFSPASIAVVGASDREASLGAVVLRNIMGGGFAGPVWPVNPRHATVGGQPAWPDIEALPQAPTLAVVCIPAAGVPALIDALGRKGTRAAIVLSAGLRAPDGATGRTLEQSMLNAARPHLLRILGPNCIGALVPGVGLNAGFAPGNALPGKLAFVTQSGALATAMLDWARGRDIGFSHFVSLGDSADIDFGDMLDYLGSDGGTRAILMYVESVKAARKFMSAARAAARNKPVILVKAGRAAAGARAAASHTGALAGSDAVFDAAVRRAGMLRVDTLEALFDAAETLSRVPRIAGERLVILTNGGGAGVLAADALALAGGSLAELSTSTLAALDACLPATWSHGNPVDIIGDAPVQRYIDALTVLLAAPETDGLLFMHAPTAIVPSYAIAAACLPLMRQAGRPLLTCWLGGPAVAPAPLACATAGIAGYGTPERAADAWMQLVHYARNQAALEQLPAAAIEDFLPQREQARALLTAAVATGDEWLAGEQVQAVLEAYGIPAIPTVRALDEDDAARVATGLGLPAALKVVSPQVVHKTDVGGVALHLATADEVRAAAAAMRARVTQLLPGAQVTGFLVQPMVLRPQARELIVGIASDAVFGPVMLFGEGGTRVEMHSAHAIGLPPLNTVLAQDLVERSGCGPLLAAHRGSAAVDLPALHSVLQRVSQMACDLDALAELDINPLLADAQGVIALDARIRLHRKGAPAPAPLAIRPYPQELERSISAGGKALLLRPIHPEDGERLKAFYADASPADMRLRFFMMRREVPHSELARYCQIDYEREMTFVAIAPPLDGAPHRLVAEARAVCDPDNLRAEFAILVARDWQGVGLGRILMLRLVEYLRQRGTGELAGECLIDNKGMMGLARATGFTVTPSPEDGTAAMYMRLR